jgi:hypothetical protein
MRSARGVVGPGHLPAQYQHLVAKDRDLYAFGFCRLAQVADRQQSSGRRGNDTRSESASPSPFLLSARSSRR